MPGWFLLIFSDINLCSSLIFLAKDDKLFESFRLFESLFEFIFVLFFCPELFSCFLTNSKVKWWKTNLKLLYLLLLSVLKKEKELVNSLWPRDLT